MGRHTTFVLLLACALDKATSDVSPRVQRHQETTVAVPSDLCARRKATFELRRARGRQPDAMAPQNGNTTAPVLPVIFRIPGCPLSHQVLNASDYLTDYQCGGFNLTSDEAFHNPLSPTTYVLELNNNIISVLPITALTNLSILTVLDLSSNAIPSLQIGCFSGLRALGTLNLSDNQITSLDVGVFSELSQLVALYLAGNVIKTVPSGVFVNMSSLEGVVLNQNDIGIIETDAFAGLTSLSVLNLANNALSALGPTVFTDLINLGTLDLSANQLTFLESKLLASQAQLTTFVAGNNAITGFGNGLFSNTASLQLCAMYTSVLTAVPGAAFSNLTALITLDLDENSLTSLPFDAFVGLTALQSLELYTNELSDLMPGLFSDLTALQYLGLHGNRLSRLQAGVFTGLTSVQTLYLQDNVLTALDDSAFAGLGTVNYMSLNGNQLTSLQGGIFEAMTSMQTLFLFQNDIQSIEVGAFSNMTALQVLNLAGNLLTTLVSEVFQPLTALQTLHLNQNGLCTLPADIFSNCTVLSSVVFQNNAITYLPPGLLNRLAPLAPVLTNPNPLQCSRTGTTFQCKNCTLGYQFNASSSSCFLPRFEPAPSLNWSTNQVDGTFGNATFSAVLYVASSYTETAPTLSPKESAFSGYSNFQDIRYQPTFAISNSVNISCGKAGTMVSGNTSGGHTGHRIPNPNYGKAFCTPDCGSAYVYDSPEAVYMFEVAAEGAVITFDTCLSTSPTSIAIYRHDSSTADGVLVFPNTTTAMTVDGFTEGVGDNQQFVAVNMTGVFPHTGGCGNLSLNAKASRVAIPNPGLYSVVIQAGGLWDYFSSAYVPNTLTNNVVTSYVLLMQCESSNQTVPSQQEQLGLYVDPITGATSAQPTSPGNYSFNLTAVDAGGSGATTVIRQWSVEVQDQPHFRLSPQSQFGYTPTLTSRQKLAVNWTYTFQPPGKDPKDYFEGVVGTAVFAVVDESSGVSGLGDDLLVSPRSGLLQVVPRKTGNYSVRIVASDKSGQINIFESPWQFEVLPATDAWNDVYGPNGRGCGPGQQVESLAHNGEYTCDCSQTPMTGPNCQKARPSVKTLIIVVVSVLITLIVGVYARYRYREYQRWRKPVSFAAHIAMHLDESVLPVVENGLVHPVEIERRNITLLGEIGHGNFGTVQRSIFRVRDNRLPGGHFEFEAAVKTLSNPRISSSRTDFLNEALITQQFNDVNICRCLGVCTVGEPFLLVLEYCSNGSLKNHLESLGDNADVLQLRKFLLDIARGMTYLASLRFVHRDLAARNVLVNAAYVCKVCDFGMSRLVSENDYYKPGVESDVALPLRWTDPAILCAGSLDGPMRFSELTDVWSFGVTAIEIFSAAEMPYRGWLFSFVLEKLSEGYRLPQPARCPDEIYSSVILSCWEASLACRPHFAELCDLLVEQWPGGPTAVPNNPLPSPLPTVSNSIDKTQGSGTSEVPNPAFFATSDPFECTHSSQESRTPTHFSSTDEYTTMRSVSSHGRNGRPIHTNESGGYTAVRHSESSPSELSDRTETFDTSSDGRISQSYTILRRGRKAIHGGTQRGSLATISSTEEELTRTQLNTPGEVITNPSKGYTTVRVGSRPGSVESDFLGVHSNPRAAMADSSRTDLHAAESDLWLNTAPFVLSAPPNPRPKSADHGQALYE